MNRRNLLKTSLGVVAGSLLSGGSSAHVLMDSKKASLSNSSRLIEHFLSSPPDMKKLKARLLANENPYGPSPKARLAMMENVHLGNRYGHGEAAELVSELAFLEGVPEDHILLGPGSSDLLEKTAIVQFQNGGNLVMADPSYMSLVKTAMYFNASMKAIPLTDDHAHDLKAMKEAIDSNTKLVYIVNPNNPTGSLTPTKDLYDFCKSVADQTPVFVDEAYIEFLEDGRSQSMVSLIAEGKDVIITRTFSKIHGMAGLRVGYMIALPSTIEKITKLSRPNMGMNIASLKAASASLSDLDFQEMSRIKTAECREFVFQSLTEMGISYIPSYTNFLMFPLATDGKAYLEQMFSHGVGVRLFEIDDAPWCRVSMGTLEEMQLFTKTLKMVLA